MKDAKPIKTPMGTNGHLDLDTGGKSVDQKVYRLLGSCFGAPKVSHEEAASAEVVSKRWPKVPFHGASAF
jgi:hypothetical protein